MKKILYVYIAVLIWISSSASAIACTGFMSFQNGTALVGNNEDFLVLADPLLKIIPPSSNDYG